MLLARYNTPTIQILVVIERSVLFVHRLGNAHRIT